MNRTSFQQRLCVEKLEARQMLTSVPFGATSQDTAEFLLGDVAVNVVLLESNGQIDADTEDWTPEAVEDLKVRIDEGLQWWVDALAKYSDVHYLNFHVDYTYADNPVESSYEPISRDSQDFSIWMEEFFRTVDIPESPSFSTEIREFNHRQRVASDTNWSFTIFVVNSENDLDHQFGDDVQPSTNFRNAFAFPGGRFIVLPNRRPAQTIAHEVGHMFWAFDEYVEGDSYSSRRGYYATLNSNGARGNPDLDSREPSIMRSLSAAYPDHLISQSARETIGWRDSDGDGIFDVLDVSHQLAASAEFDEGTRTVRLQGNSSVRTLVNRNPSGTGNNMTINRINGLQYRIDGGAWQDIGTFDDYSVEIDETTPAIPLGVDRVDFRTIDNRIGVTSNLVSVAVTNPNPEAPLLQNPELAHDVNGDGFVTAIDALQIIHAINRGTTTLTEPGPPYLDVTGDSVLTARDALLVINYINARATITSGPVDVNGEPDPAEVEVSLASEASTSASELSIEPLASVANATDFAMATAAAKPSDPSAREFWFGEDENSDSTWFWS